MYRTGVNLSANSPCHSTTNTVVENILMSQTALSDVAIAIASDSLQQRTNLRRLMTLTGLNVVLSEPLTRLFLHKLEKADADVLLLDLHDDTDHDDGLLHEVLDKVEIPIIFNDVTALTLNESAADSKWHFSLMQKIADLRGIDDWQSAEFEQPEIPEELLNKKEPKLRHDQNLASQVWVLGASLGGPETLKRFLKALPKDIPAGFIITQHLGANFVTKLAEQLNRYTKLKVIPPRDGHVFLEGDVIITPVGERLKINPIGNVELNSLTDNTHYTPSIDLTISDVAERYGDRAGAIIFSGMGDDGKLGCARLLEKGGQVWLQSSESCVISSMPDNVKKVCDVQFVGNTEQLARKLTEHLEAIEGV
ncbi:Chemotaxis response regulator protein-glutamate methylesterase CheB [hydrothermal vent metagenome]|uniref:protein-glutamate methylesterase n=1 Tax=hydrothermal vent metagenome TaxID=652676 RepID=A0A3B1AK98_9ZZZZ